ncbi:MAG: hypothetical protein KKA07_06820 [Bacteroidetes bacterium]|nr:hypothetical protein [Bacteroidota bacterium]MBU1718770.1 hypothetical protein [Bacteroidota bacterium]
MAKFSIKTLAVILIMACMPIISDAQINKFGIPFIRNYSPKEYNASEQNWAVVQDNRGVMYFGNSDNGILEYDGAEWRQILIPNNSIVRSLAVDSTGTVFVGAANEFGYLNPDEHGKMHYISLSASLDTSNQNFSHVWKTHGKEKGAYFCTQTRIFSYSPGAEITTYTLEDGCLLSFLVNNTLYSSNVYKGLQILKNNKISEAIGGENFADKDIFGIVPYQKNKLLVAAIPGGLFIYDPISGEVIPAGENEECKALSDELDYNGVYNILKTKTGDIVFITLYNGVYVTDANLNLKHHISTGNGLQYETVTSVFQHLGGEFSDPVWLSLYSGVSSIELNSPLAGFTAESGLGASVFDVITLEGKLYVGTSKGLYYLAFSSGKPIFAKVQEINGQVFSFVKMDDGTGKEICIAGTADDIFKIQSGHAINLNTKLVNVFTTYASRFKKGRLYLGLPNGAGLGIYDFVGGIPHKVNDDIEIHEETVAITEDENQNLWLSTSYDGLIRITPDRKVTKYNTTNGLPADDKNFVRFANNRIFICTTKGLYRFDEKSQKFYPDSSIHPRYAAGDLRISNISADFDKNYWIVCARGNQFWVERLLHNESGKYDLDTISLRRLPKGYIEKTVSDSTDLTWICATDGLYSFQSKFANSTDRDFNTLIRKVTLMRNDSVLFFGTGFLSENPLDSTSRVVSLDQPVNLKPVLEYRFNSLTFQFASPWFIAGNLTEYSYFLEGYDEVWSKWTHETKKDYTNLSEGKYTFMVKARNLYGHESRVATFSFKVLPPWYRTVWAYIMYVAILVFIVWLIIKLALRRMKKLNIAYGRYLPGSFLKLLEKRRVIDFKLGDMTQRDMTIMFSDIRAYTSLSETMTPAENFKFQVRYLSQIGDMLNNNNGFAVQFYGDGVVAMFRGDSTDEAVQATVDMHRKVMEYSAERIKKGRRPLKIGVGVHTGNVVMGIRGDMRRWEGGIVGDSVNLASRMEGLTKMYGASTIISDDTYKRLKKPEKFNIRFLGKVKVKGKEIPVGIYEILDGLPEEEFNLKFNALKHFNSGLFAYFQKNIATAESEFRKALAIHPDEVSTIHYLSTIEQLKNDGIPDDWDGVEKMDKK